MRPNDVCPILRTHPSQSPYLYTYRSIEPSLFVLLNIECFGLVCCEHPIQDALGPYILTGTPEILFDYYNFMVSTMQGAMELFMCVFLLRPFFFDSGFRTRVSNLGSATYGICG